MSDPIKPDENGAKLDLRQIVARLEQAEIELLAMRTESLTLLESSLDGVILIDQRGRILNLNSHAAEMFGYTIEELRYKIVEILVPADQRDAHVHHRRAYNLSPKSRPMGQGIAMGLQGCRKNGSLFYLGISLNRISVEGTAVTCLVCTVL
jgi:PAS domain S-box-containing protein